MPCVYSRKINRAICLIAAQLFAVAGLVSSMLGAESISQGKLDCSSKFSELLADYSKSGSRGEFLLDQQHREELVREKFDKLDLGQGTFDFFVKRLSPFNKFGLTDAEIAMLGTYTGHGHKVLNAALREKGINLKEVRPFIETLNSALQKLPNYAGLVTRSSTWMPPSELAEHQVGNIVTYPAYTSASARGGAGRLLFKIRSKSGKQLFKLSMNPVEDEVLFLPGTRFKVLKRTDFEWGWTEFELEEI